ncbi:MAG TPA: acetate kinase, partial [Candidatus Eisenbacteria bacterium]|nr:acetate kinase [Candidatus Eisenbacteria bacterium]
MTRGSILVLNAGSSSLKFALFDADGRDVLAPPRAHGEVEGLGTQPRLTVDRAGGGGIARDLTASEARTPEDAIGLVVGWLREHRGDDALAAVGHRVVHGGTVFTRPTLVDDDVYRQIEALVPLAPLHQPQNLAAIRAVRAWRRDLPQVACFDTAFHRDHPLLADLYALPWEYYEAGVRRYGFHGLSYEYVASILPQIAPDLAAGRTIVA